MTIQFLVEKRSKKKMLLMDWLVRILSKSICRIQSMPDRKKDVIIESVESLCIFLHYLLVEWLALLSSIELARYMLGFFHSGFYTDFHNDIINITLCQLVSYYHDVIIQSTSRKTGIMFFIIFMAFLGKIKGTLSGPSESVVLFIILYVIWRIVFINFEEWTHSDKYVIDYDLAKTEEEIERAETLKNGLMDGKIKSRLLD